MGGIGLGGILVIVGIILAIVWNLWIGIIIALIGSSPSADSQGAAGTDQLGGIGGTSAAQQAFRQALLGGSRLGGERPATSRKAAKRGKPQSSSRQMYVSTDSSSSSDR